MVKVEVTMNQISYDRSWYQKYAKGEPLDEAKKYLEYRVAFHLIQEIPLILLSQKNR